MSEKHLSEEKIQARMSTITLPGTIELQTYYDNLTLYLKSNVFSKKAFQEKVNAEFSAYTFEFVENLAELARAFLIKHVNGHESGMEVLDLLSKCLDSSIPFLKRAKAISMLTEEALDNC